MEFHDAGELACAVRDSIGMPFTARPYNCHKPNDSLWWLVPSRDWPAFRYAKLFFSAQPDHVPRGETGIYCGVSVEKGLSPKFKGVYAAELIHTAQWDWDSFTARLAKEFPILPTPQCVRVWVRYVNPKESGVSVRDFLAQKETENFSPSDATFKIDAQQRLVLHDKNINYKVFDIAQHCESRVCASKTMSQLINALVTVPQSECCWVDLYIGSTVTSGTLKQLWNDRLKPWSGWHKGSKGAVVSA